MGLIVNIALRLTLLYFLGEVLLLPDDPRFAGKAIPIRNLIIVVTFSLLLPFIYWLMKKWSGYPFKKWQKYPWWLDNLYLSIFWLDMAGNSFNLYDTYPHFNLIPHFHGAGAIAVIFFGAFGISGLASVGLATIIHVLLEAQEYYTDVFAGTHNVGDISDTINDLLAGILGSLIYLAIFLWFRRQRKTST